MRGRLKAAFHDTGRKAKNPPQPGFPDGLHIDAAVNAKRKCSIELDYPSIGIGTWEVRCTVCGVSVGLTAAGRADDPRRVTLPCGIQPGSAERHPWTPEHTN